MKPHVTANHHSSAAIASSNNNRLLIWCQAVSWRIWHSWLWLSEGLTKKSSWVVGLIVVAGLSLRLWLGLTMPIWGDEMFTIWMVRHDFTKVLTQAIDVVHPPGYYVLVKAWWLVSDQLQWLRLPSLLMSGLNMLLLWQVGRKEATQHPQLKSLPNWLVVTYALSGYHLVFDWSVRMYSLVLGWSLATWWCLQRPQYWRWLGLLAGTGLLLDYGYFWSYLVFWAWAALKAWWQPTASHLKQLLSLTLGSVPFGLWQIHQWSLFHAGMDGILWMKPFLFPNFFGPFFLGTHQSWGLSLVVGAVFGMTIWWAYQHRTALPTTVWWLVGGALVLIEVTLLYSLLKQPILHVRSLQIVGLAATYLWALSLTYKPTRLLSLVLLLVVAGRMPSLLQNFPGSLLLELYPWQLVRTAIIANQPHYGSQLFVEPRPNSPSPLLYEGLLYTLQGKAQLFQPPIAYTVGPPPTSADCTVLWGAYARVTLCQ